MGEVQLTLSQFNDDEKEQFNKTWIAMVSIWNRDGMILMFTEADRKLTMVFAMAFKFRRDEETFAGSNPVFNNQFGMRWGLAESFLQDDAGAPAIRVLDWLQDADLTAGAWITGRRNWMSTRPANTGSFDDVADGEIILTDPLRNDEFWGAVFLAFQEFNPSPIAKQILVDLNRRPQVPVYVRWHLLTSEMQLMKLDNALLIQDDMPVRIGVEVVLPNTVPAAASFFQPIIAEFFSNRRGLADNTAVAFPRPTPA